MILIFDSSKWTVSLLNTLALFEAFSEIFLMLLSEWFQFFSTFLGLFIFVLFCNAFCDSSNHAIKDGYNYGFSYSTIFFISLSKFRCFFFILLVSNSLSDTLQWFDRSYFLCYYLMHSHQMCFWWLLLKGEW